MPAHVTLISFRPGSQSIRTLEQLLILGPGSFALYGYFGLLLNKEASFALAFS